MIQWLWVIFSLVFLLLSMWHFCQSREYIRKFENKAEIKSFNGLNLGINDFIKDFNEYIKKQNKQSKQINQIASFGYFISFLISIYSYHLSLMG